MAKRKAIEEEDLVFTDEDESSDEPVAKSRKPRVTKAESSDAADVADIMEQQESQVAMLAGLEQVEDELYEEMEYDEDAEQLHPAEVAALYQTTLKTGQIGGSDEQILKDLRKMVFTVPLLHQQDVHKYFLQIDQIIFPTVFSILETSQVFLEEVIQIVIKVAAGNTYGKNIYEKEDNYTLSEPEQKSTYRNHEVSFLKNAYGLLRYSAQVESGEEPSQPIEKAMEQCSFIRGVYEDILRVFVESTKGYDNLHWLAVKAKFADDMDEYHKIVNLIELMDQKYKLNKSAFYIVREARRIYERYTELRSFIITPYLRAVYSAAKNTAKNAHQMLDNFQNGSIGLMRAVSCYSTKRQASFASVAKWWIKQMMLLTIKENANFVKLPVSTWQSFTHLEKIRAKIGATDDNYEAIAKASSMSAEKIKSIYHTIRISQVYSLNKTYDSDERLTLEDVMTEDDNLGGPVDEYAIMLREYCANAHLTTTEIIITALRHGMLDLIKARAVPEEEVMREALVQNLACLGYSFTFEQKAAS